MATGAEINFLTATEFKGAEDWDATPSFAVLFRRVRDRISALSSFYGERPLVIDFAAAAARAESVRVERFEFRRVEAVRRSRRSGQTHSLGGFAGRVEYAGELTEFLPYLEAAQWTGVGRQTVWGKGELLVRTREPSGTTMAG